MPQCSHCGFPLPDGAVYCPSCGAPVRRKIEVPVPSAGAMLRIIQAGVIGAFLTVMMESLSPGIDLYFLPAFASSLISVYISRVRRLDEAVGVALAVYLFADAITGGIILGSLYAQRIPLAEIYGDYVPSLVDVLAYAASPVTAVIAGYIGARLAPATRARELPPVAYRREEEPGGVIYILPRE